MMTQNKDKKRGKIQIFCMDDMVPQDHLLRIIDKADVYKRQDYGADEKRIGHEDPVSGIIQRERCVLPL